MAREFLIVWVGRPREPWEALCADYRKRIQRLHGVRDLPIKPLKASDDRTRLEAEARAILGALPEPCYLVALDRLGKSLDSVKIARSIEDLQDTWPHPVAVVIGSDLGLSKTVSGSREMPNLTRAAHPPA